MHSGPDGRKKPSSAKSTPNRRDRSGQSPPLAIPACPDPLQTLYQRIPSRDRRDSAGYLRCSGPDRPMNPSRTAGVLSTTSISGRRDHQIVEVAGSCAAERKPQSVSAACRRKSAHPSTWSDVRAAPIELLCTVKSVRAEVSSGPGRHAWGQSRCGCWAADDG